MGLVIRSISFVLSVFLLSFCSDPVEPVRPDPDPEPDTTSHDWIFTLYEVGEMNSRLLDVQALSVDFVIAVGNIEGPFMVRNPNSYIWNGTEFLPNSLPIRAAISTDEDTGTVIIPQSSVRIVNAAWVFRRDNLWCGTDLGAYSHITIAGLDTMVKNENWERVPDIHVRSMWAADTNDLFFGCGRGNVLRYHNDSWTNLPMIGGPERNYHVRRLWGSGTDNLFSFTRHSGTEYRPTFQHFDGTGWKEIWRWEDPPFGGAQKRWTLFSCWAAAGDDSMWVVGSRLARMRTDAIGGSRLFDSLEYAFQAVDGSASNNVFFVGLDGILSHYNGASLKSFERYRDQRITFHDVATLRDEVYIVGSRYFGGAIFVHGRRIK